VRIRFGSTRITIFAAMDSPASRSLIEHAPAPPPALEADFFLSLAEKIEFRALYL